MGNKVLAVACAGMLLVPGVWAEEPSAETGESLVELDKIVVTPYRYEEALSNTPSSVTVITSGEIKDANAQRVVDGLRTIPGVTVSDFYGTGVAAAVDMAGFGASAAVNVLVLIDGRRVNNVDLSGVDWSQVPLDQVERIEVINGGSAGVLYGDNAFSGVVNIITRKGSGKPKLSMEADYGSYDMNKQKLSLKGALDNRFSYWLNAGRESTNGYRENTFYKANDFASKLEYDFNDASSMHFNSGFHASTFGLPGALFQHHINERGRRSARYGEDHVNNKDYYFVLGPKLKDPDFGGLTSDFTFRRTDSDAYFLTSHNPTRKNEILTFGATPRYTLDKEIFGCNNKIVAGLDFYRYYYHSNQYFFNNEILKDSTLVKKTSIGGYLQDEFNLFRKLVMVAGYRYEAARYVFAYHDSDTGFGHPFPDQDKKALPTMQAFNSGLVYTYKDDSSVFLNAGRTFRFPEVDEFTFQDINFQQQLNTDLKPQSAINYQFGARHKFSDKLMFNISFFRMNVSDELYFNPNGGPFGFGQNENYDSTVHQGIQSSIEARLRDRASFFLNYTFTDAYFDGGVYGRNKIPMVARHKGSVGFRFNLPKSITLNVTGTYVGSRYFINDTPNALSQLNGYTVCDTNLSWSHRDLTVTFGINNLFNKQYSEYGVFGFDSSTFLMDKAYYPSPGRNFSLRLDYSF